MIFDIYIVFFKKKKHALLTNKIVPNRDLFWAGIFVRMASLQTEINPV